MKNKKLTKREKVFLQQEMNRYRLGIEAKCAEVGLQLQEQIQGYRAEQQGEESDCLPRRELEIAEDLYGL